IVSTFTVMRRSGFDLTGLLAATTVVTSIMALSLQATLGNILGGVALQLDNSIHAGDWVKLENGKQGKVREIRWRHTVIETRDWDTVIVPNSALLGANIIILGKRDGERLQHRMWVYFNVDFRYPPADVIKTVEDALHAAPIEGVAATPKANVVCMDFAKDNRDSFAYYAARYWLTDLPRDDPTSSRVRTRIYAALKRAGIPLAVPAAQLFVEQDDVSRRERKKLRELSTRLQALHGLEFLKPLKDAEREDVAGRLRYAPFAAGETITKQGALAHWLYIITHGVVEVHVSSDDGSDKIVATIKAPGFFGEMGLMTGEPRTATVIASSDVECFRLDKTDFERILTERPEIAAEMAHLLASRRVELQAAKEDLDAEAKQKRLDAEKTRILGTIQDFFGLRDTRV
ncbi:MAG TPA: mechanosensitive ion channel family protein, partial [Polyangiaceae bacterium]